MDPMEILRTPLLNKGTAFTEEERELLGLHGLLPTHVSSLEEQIKRSYASFSQKKTPLGKYNNLVSLLSRNECLFFQFALKYAREVLPIIYTPTVGEAAIHYSHIYFNRRGLYLSLSLKDKLDAILASYPDDIDVIVVTDAERILGLGDQGIGGMTIPIGKLCLYTLFGGIHPAKTLPITLDVGTNNPALLADDMYLGARHERIRGAEYDAFIDLFIKAVKKRYPNVLLQWEDFGKMNARRLLDRYRSQILSFNDDIQGTAAVTVAALLAACKVKKQTLSDQRIVILGGGSAGLGIADMIAETMKREGAKTPTSQIYIVDIHGLITFATHDITPEQKPYAHERESFKNWQGSLENISLLDVVKNVKPTVLIGVSAQGGAFNEEILKEMSKTAEFPIIFPLSNPTSKAECTAEEAIRFSDGKALIATGSPFDPVVYKEKSHVIAQCNNVYIFPGVGLGAIAAQAREVTDNMFQAATHTLAEFSPALRDPTLSLFPDIEEVRSVSLKIARAVAEQAIKDGVSPLKSVDVEAHVWTPTYPTYRKKL